ncbi:MAG: short chain dehydrogenase [Porticoccus sp.]|nr:MAG: short chain dehydrogenase [Porticoccus sp.]
MGEVKTQERMLMKAFAEKVVIVTGATSGLGEAAALKFAREGASVVLAARREDKGQAVLQKIEALGAEGMFIKTDVTDGADVQAVVEKTLARFGKLDCAVNSAGISGPVLVPVADVEETDWDALMDTNLKAVWMCMKYQIRAMLKRGAGSIVNISSIYGYKPSDVGHAPYCASKYALIGLSKSAAVDYGQQGIRVNVVSPGYTHSEMIDPVAEAQPEFINAVVNRYSAMNRLGRAEETAEATAWLCSDAASFVNGAVLPVDGGDTTRLY